MVTKSSFSQFYKSFIPLLQPRRFNSNMIITKRKGKQYCEAYKCLVVYSDGSSAEIRYHEPKAIIKLPYNPLDPIDKAKLDALAAKTVVKNVYKEDELENEFNVGEYDYLWKKK